ncbi:hypothetical protein [Sorangium sp. So ce542]|uniref:hypothetical protein n=1 Tax=Sorangium sp. So ce542 TaxID=3133316 RepID=UPI003F61A3DF
MNIDALSPKLSPNPCAARPSRRARRAALASALAPLALAGCAGAGDAEPTSSAAQEIVGSTPRANLQPLGGLSRHVTVEELDLGRAIAAAVADAGPGAAPLEVRYDVLAAAVAIQGILNRDGAKLWLKPDPDSPSGDHGVPNTARIAELHRALWARQGGTFNVSHTYDSLLDLIQAHRAELVRANLWSPEHPEMLNVAMTWAGRFSGIPARRGSWLASRLAQAGLPLDELPFLYQDAASNYDRAAEFYLNPPPATPAMLGDFADGRVGAGACASSAAGFWAGYDVGAQLYARDYVIANRGFFMSLRPYPDGAGVNPFRDLLSSRFSQAMGAGIGTIVGFPAVDVDYAKQSWPGCQPGAGSMPHDDHQVEWWGVDQASRSNYTYDVGAQGPANGSVLARWPLADRYEQPWVGYIKPSAWKDEARIVSYATYIVGDYDSPDWLSWDLEEWFQGEVEDPTVPLGWEVTPLAAGRAPLDLEWLLNNTKRGSVVTGANSGFGYVNPDALPDKRAWLDAMLATNRRFGTTIMGYALNGHSGRLSAEAIRLMAAAFPGGVVTDWQYDGGQFNAGHGFDEGQLVAGATPVITQAFNINGQMTRYDRASGACGGCGEIAAAIASSVDTRQVATVSGTGIGRARPLPFQVIHGNRTPPGALAALRQELDGRHIKVVSPLEFFARLRAYQLQAWPDLPARVESSGTPGDVAGSFRGPPAGFTAEPSAPCAVPSHLIGRADSAYYYSNAFLDAYCRYGGQGALGVPADNGGGHAVHWWVGGAGQDAGRAQDFDGNGQPALLAQGPDGLVRRVRGVLRAAVLARGGLPALGFPTGDEVVSGGWISQAFARKTLRCPAAAVDPSQCVDTPAGSAPIGHLDGIGATGVTWGWALDPDIAAQPISVRFYVDGNRDAGEVVARQPRADVNAGTGFPGDHGFVWSVPASFRDNQPHELYAYAVDPSGAPSALTLLSRAPMKFQLPPNRTPIGYLGEIKSAGVVWGGWTFDPDSPEQSLSVHFYIDGVFVDSAAATIPRQDVNDYHRVPGNHGFQWTIPGNFRDCRPHRLSGYPIDTSGLPHANAEFPDSPRTFTLCP